MSSGEWPGRAPGHRERDRAGSGSSQRSRRRRALFSARPAALAVLLLCSACNMVPVVDHPKLELRVHPPLDLVAIQRLRVGDSQGLVRAELGEPHHQALGTNGTITWRYWVFQAASQIAAELLSAADEGIWARGWAWTDRFLFVPSRQPWRQPRVSLPAEAHELVIVFSPQGAILASRFQSLKAPLGQ